MTEADDFDCDGLKNKDPLKVWDSFFPFNEINLEEDKCVWEPWLLPDMQADSDFQEGDLPFTMYSDQRGDACDNCPFVLNPFQEDWDRNGIGDACDEESDARRAAVPICSNDVEFDVSINDLSNAPGGDYRLWMETSGNTEFTAELRVLNPDESVIHAIPLGAALLVRRPCGRVVMPQS